MSITPRTPTHYRSSSFTSDIPTSSASTSSNYLQPYAMSSPARPSIPHSSSLPALLSSPPPSVSPSNTRRLSTSSSHSSTYTPTKSNQTNYSHPYLIHTTSSAALSRNNTSPAKPINGHTHTYTGHRVSKSMGTLRSSQSVDDLRIPDSPTPGSPSASYPHSYHPPERRKLGSRYSISDLSDLNQPGSPLVSEKHLKDTERAEKKMGKVDLSVWEWKLQPKDASGLGRELPSNPKLWTAHETAHYISHCLTTGLNPDPTSRTLIKRLPSPVIADITGWIIKGRVGGKGFLAGGEGSWASSSKPPPFLHVLLSLSRNLRRAALKGNIAGLVSESYSAGDHDLTNDQANTAEDVSLDGHVRDTSVLQEEEDEEQDQEGEEGGNVRRLAHDWDTRSVSSASTGGSQMGDDDRPALRQRSMSTSSEASSIGSEFADRAMRFERTAEMNGNRGSVGAKYGRVVDKDEDSGGWDVAKAGLDALVPKGVQPGSVIDGLPATGMNNRSSIGLGIYNGSHNGRDEDTEQVHILPEENHATEYPFISPPPAYTSPNFNAAFESVAHKEDAGDQTVHSQTPEAEQPSTGRSGDSEHMSHMLQHQRAGARPYGALRRSSSSGGPGGPRLPTMQSLRAGVHTWNEQTLEATSADAEGDDQRDLGRRVTIRPVRKVTEVFKPVESNLASNPADMLDASACPTPVPVQPSKGPIQDDHVAELVKRLQDAEKRILELQRELARKADEVERSPKPTMGSHNLALIYGGMAGLCICVVVLKVFGRRGIVS